MFWKEADTGMKVIKKKEEVWGGMMKQSTNERN
jgi:hypothetical protein